ncbi:hypothetical protein [Hymenobacter sp. CRA2]|uniref:hypothetical protein n=1 Tax=Hymenobacter sp. CRA2 TaxID=1955620 RepID=UPI00098F5A99|nr:hypothetical protein [Hymenobacter sp. CRA2]OON69766.1 hypothetical protein B0919_07520 [Hymenobacter sp. CRA2]
MKLALELEFPDDQAANVLRLLQSLPETTATVIPHPATTTALSAAEQQRLMHELFGAWQSEETGEELAKQLREARHFRDREIEL